MSINSSLALLHVKWVQTIFRFGKSFKSSYTRTNPKKWKFCFTRTIQGSWNFVSGSSKKPADFSTVVLFIDEANFSCEGMYNTENSHIWSDEHPRVMYKHHHHNRVYFHVWSAIVGDNSIGSYMLPPYPSGSLFIFSNWLSPLLLEVLRYCGDLNTINLGTFLFRWNISHSRNRNTKYEAYKYIWTRVGVTYMR